MENPVFDYMTDIESFARVPGQESGGSRKKPTASDVYPSLWSLGPTLSYEVAENDQRIDVCFYV